MIFSFQKLELYAKILIFMCFINGFANIFGIITSTINQSFWVHGAVGLTMLGIGFCVLLSTKFYRQCHWAFMVVTIGFIGYLVYSGEPASIYVSVLIIIAAFCAINFYDKIAQILILVVAYYIVENFQMTYFLPIILLMAVMGVVIAFVYEQHRLKTRKLLLQLMPAPVLREMEQLGHYKPRLKDKTSIIFTDFVGFTEIASHSDPQEILAILNMYFQKFSDIGTQMGVIRIKTIGDGCLMAVGIFDDNNHHADIALQYAEKLRDLVANDSKTGWKIRIGIHSGDCMMGVIGQDNAQFDIWGDTVNVASRMEKAANGNGVCLSADTYHALTTQPKTQSQTLNIKGKGMMEIYHF